jgi:hypothetical protein
MFTRIVVLLTALPMLAPPGLCLCRLLEGGRSAPAAAEVAETTPPEEHCPCCVPHAATDAADEAPPSPPPPRCPQCPEREPQTLAKAEAPAQAADLDAADWVAHTDLLPTPLAARHAPAPAPQAPAAPLYLLCRDLLC